MPSASPEEISVLHLAWLIKACHGIDELFGDAQADRVIGGTQTVARRVAERLKDEIKFGQPVRRIEWNDKGAVVQSDSIAVAARRVIVACRRTSPARIEYAPALPMNRMQVTQRWPQGLVIKVSMVYSAPFWRDDGLNGTLLRPHLGDGRDRGLQQSGSISPRPASSPASSIPTMRARSRRWRPEERKTHPARRGRQALRAEGARAGATITSSNWTEAQWTRGCFTGFLTPGATTLFGSAVRDPVGPIHWAGTETSTDWPSFIDGAIRSGEREAEAIRKTARLAVGCVIAPLRAALPIRYLLAMTHDKIF